MKSGIIGTTNGSPELLEPVYETFHQDGREFIRCVEIRNEDSEQGVRFQEGRAALETVEEREQVQIDEEGRISTYEEPAKVTQYTDFLYVPGQFVVIDGGTGEFALDMIQEQVDGGTVKRANIDLSRFLESQNDLTPWQVGFYGRNGETEKGTLYGDSILSDSKFGNEVDALEKNQLGAIFEYDGRKVKMTMTESGYVEVYQPRNFDSGAFAKFTSDRVLPFVKEKEV